MNQPIFFNLRVIVFISLFAAASLCTGQVLPAPVTATVSVPSSAPAAAAQPPQAARGDQVIQKIRIEDAGSRIDEVRVGGQTQSITVQPKTGVNVPAYEIKPSDTARGAAPSPANGDTTGSRVWNVLKF